MSAALLADQAAWAARPGRCWSAGCRPAGSVGGAIGSHDGIDFACAQHAAQLRFVENGVVEVAVIFAGAHSVDTVEISRSLISRAWDANFMGSDMLMALVSVCKRQTNEVLSVGIVLGKTL
ncbi:hypothetical protein [Sphingobium yanoikuyae]|uniref:hypothetical protein n=1 Tax=Sphingobium yanoikuyae TaxID=13690 RepID=UPI0015F6F1E4|nr:hypothetical protein [Sphingobium yanoikuyae]MDV3477869.1 hypothetical protein [Sphingobium yanoikuyae]